MKVHARATERVERRVLTLSMKEVEDALEKYLRITHLPLFGLDLKGIEYSLGSGKCRLSFERKKFNRKK